MILEALYTDLPVHLQAISAAMLTALASAGGTLFNIGSSLGSRQRSREAAHRAFKRRMELARMQNKFNRNEARRQREWNLKMWKRANRYNHPAAQMKRFEQAGLNKHLMYGKGSPGNAGSVQSYDRANIKMPVDSPMPSQMTEVINQQKLNANRTRAQTIATHTQALMTGIEAANKAIQGARSKFEFEKAKELRETSIETAEKNLERLNAQIDLAEQQRDKLNPKLAKKLDAELEKIIAEEMEISARTDLTKQNLLTEENITKLKKLENELKKEGLDREAGPFGLSMIIRMFLHKLRGISESPFVESLIDGDPIKH